MTYNCEEDSFLEILPGTDSLQVIWGSVVESSSTFCWTICLEGAKAFVRVLGVLRQESNDRGLDWNIENESWCCCVDETGRRFAILRTDLYRLEVIEEELGSDWRVLNYREWSSEKYCRLICWRNQWVVILAGGEYLVADGSGRAWLRRIRLVSDLSRSRSVLDNLDEGASFEDLMSLRDWNVANVVINGDRLVSWQGVRKSGSGEILSLAIAATDLDNAQVVPTYVDWGDELMSVGGFGKDFLISLADDDESLRIRSVGFGIVFAIFGVRGLGQVGRILNPGTVAEDRVSLANLWERSQERSVKIDDRSLWFGMKRVERLLNQQGVILCESTENVSLSFRPSELSEEWLQVEQEEIVRPKIEAEDGANIEELETSSSNIEEKAGNFMISGTVRLGGRLRDSGTLNLVKSVYNEPTDCGVLVEEGELLVDVIGRLKQFMESRELFLDNGC